MTSLMIQGKDHTYCPSGLNSFELVEYTIRAARNLVETHLLSEIITMVKYCEFSEAGALFYQGSNSEPVRRKEVLFISR